MDINLMLCSKSDNIEKIKYVYSHPQALAQCRKFLKKFKLKALSCESTAKACEIAKKDLSAAAIASIEAAKFYNLNILYENIQDYKSQTRFIVIYNKEREENFISNKTSIIFSLEDKPGSLYNALGEFAKRNINLKKIESRPSKRILGEYFFFLDI
ncbi:MAG: prephenate dehydratase, partial [Candidatus Altarchaeaceae archaeon]